MTLQGFRVFSDDDPTVLQDALNHWSVGMSRMSNFKIRRTQLAQSSYVDPHATFSVPYGQSKSGEVKTIFTALVNYEYEETEK